MNMDADKTVLEELMAKWSEATNQAGDAGADGFISYITADAVMLPSNAERLDGRAVIREWVLGLTSLEGFKISWKTNRIDVATDGSLAHAIGQYELSMKGADGRTVTDKGTFLDALEKQADGSWLCNVGSWSTDLPAFGSG